MFDTLSDFLRDAPAVVFLFAFGIPVLLSGLTGWAAVRSRRIAGALAALPETTVDRLAPGPALASGRVDAKAAVRAPLTGRPCAWVEAIVDESVERGNDRDSDRTWRRIRDETSGNPIRFAWNGAGAQVDPRGATVFHSGWSQWYGPAAAPEDRDPDLHPGDQPMGGARFEVMSDPRRRFRYRERYVFAGDPLFVLGEARAAGSGAPTAIVAGQGLPFVISTRSPAEVRADSRLAVKGGVVMAAVCAALAVFVLVLRFG